MRWAVVASVLALATVAAAFATAGSAQSRHPQLRLTSTEPVTVRGTGFGARKRVRIVLRAPALGPTKTMTTSSGGSFTATFPNADVNACAGFSVTATAADGSHATLKRPPGQCALP